MLHGELNRLTDLKLLESFIELPGGGEAEVLQELHGALEVRLSPDKTVLLRAGIYEREPARKNLLHGFFSSLDRQGLGHGQAELGRGGPGDVGKRAGGVLQQASVDRLGGRRLVVPVIERRQLGAGPNPPGLRKAGAARGGFQGSDLAREGSLGMGEPDRLAIFRRRHPVIPGRERGCSCRLIESLDLSICPDTEGELKEALRSTGRRGRIFCISKGEGLDRLKRILFAFPDM